MSHECEFVTGAQGGTSGDPVINVCGVLASIKTLSGRWLCADHYDSIDDLPPVAPDDVYALD